MRIHATSLKTNKQVFGSLNIGELQETDIVTIDKQPVFKNENGELFSCSIEMKERINERLLILKGGFTL